MDRGMERVKGIEPSYSAWEAAALPLSYTRSGNSALAQAMRSGQLECARTGGLFAVYIFWYA